MSGIAYCLIDRDGRVIGCNPASKSTVLHRLLAP